MTIQYFYIVPRNEQHILGYNYCDYDKLSPAKLLILSFKLQSYLKNKAFIVTKYPPPEDAVDFLRLLNDHKSDTVICMNSLNEIESVSFT